MYQIWLILAQLSLRKIPWTTAYNDGLMDHHSDLVDPRLCVRKKFANKNTPKFKKTKTDIFKIKNIYIHVYFYGRFKYLLFSVTSEI